MSTTSKVLPFELKNKPHLQEVPAPDISHKTPNCKSCGSTALKLVDKNRLDRLINGFLPIVAFQCYSCGTRNRLVTDSIRSTVTLVLFSLVAAAAVVFSFNNYFQLTPPSIDTAKSKQIITPALKNIEVENQGVVIASSKLEKQHALLNSFDLSFRDPPVFSAGVLSATPINSASSTDSTPRIEMDLSSDSTLVLAIAETEGTTVAKVQLSLPKLKGLEIFSNQALVATNKTVSIPIQDRYYYIELLRKAGSGEVSKQAGMLANNLPSKLVLLDQ
ncbi:MAG: hypothetical protein ACI9I4_001958 [Neolewinella sp.]|jgi:hypothetical protein